MPADARENLVILPSPDDQNAPGEAKNEALHDAWPAPRFGSHGFAWQVFRAGHKALTSYYPSVAFVTQLVALAAFVRSPGSLPSLTLHADRATFPKQSRTASSKSRANQARDRYVRKLSDACENPFHTLT
jgi:hypothetical protein